ncbi:hypothetical protein JCM10212_003938 [Sporobolomyces blumeae]
MRTLLPPELWDHVLSLVPPDQLQRTALALSRALPSSDFSSSYLWRHLRLSREGQSWDVIQKLRQQSHLRNHVRTVDSAAFREDPQHLVNLVQSLPHPRKIHLNVGPLFSPEHLDDLLHPSVVASARHLASLEHLSFRFNPYCMERSYFVFLKGTYFDSIVLNLAHLDLAAAPHLEHVSFEQDLSPNHGAEKKKETPAFGLHELGDELNEIEATGAGTLQQPPASGRFARKKVENGGKMDFAQPIVFFRLDCLSILATSPVGSRLTHLTLRLPRRNLLTALTTPSPAASATNGSTLSPSFPSLTYLDLATTHLIDDARFPTLLRMHPKLTHLVIDRCTGLISRDAVDENTAIVTMKWLGKCCGGVGFSRAEEALRAWRRIVKERPADAPNVPHSARRTGRRPVGSRRVEPSLPPTASSDPTSTSPSIDTLVPPVRELFVVPPLPSLRSLSAGLHSHVGRRTERLWTEAFEQGYQDMVDKCVVRIEEYVERWEAWRRMGKLGDGTRRIVTFKDAFDPVSPAVGVVGERATNQPLDDDDDEDEDEHQDDPDPTFEKFLKERNLVKISPSTAHDLSLLYRSQLEERFTVCFVPDCTDAAGVPRLSLERNGRESRAEREDREKAIDEREKRDRSEWRKAASLHKAGCGHLERRRAWLEEEGEA